MYVHTYVRTYVHIYTCRHAQLWYSAGVSCIESDMPKQSKWIEIVQEPRRMPPCQYTFRRAEVFTPCPGFGSITLDFLCNLRISQERLLKSVWQETCRDVSNRFGYSVCVAGPGLFLWYYYQLCPQPLVLHMIAIHFTSIGNFEPRWT